MLDQLTDRLARIVKQVRGQARLTEANMQEALREVRLALLEADVALPVVRDFIARVRESAVGEDVIGSLTPGQALVGVVHRELVRLMGGDLPQKQRDLDLATQPPAIILLAGLQGSGKTTTTGKLGRWLSIERRKKVLAVSTDVSTGSHRATANRLPAGPNRVFSHAAAKSPCGDRPGGACARASSSARRRFG